MSASSFAPSRFLVSRLSGSAPRLAQSSRLTASRRHAQLRYNSTKQTEGKSFKGQLYESTAHRLEREKLEQAKFAKERGTTGAGQQAALAYGMRPE
jgi:D-lactate dehydrogenase (cytochrome)